MPYQREAKFDAVSPSASPEEVARAVGAITDKLNRELTRLEQSTPTQGVTAQIKVMTPDYKTVTLTFRNGVLVSQ